MSSQVGNGFGQGCGWVVGALLAGLLVCGGCQLLGRVVMACPSCQSSGQCALCSGTGQGLLWGDCLHCAGRKRCPQCGGSGWRMK